MSAPKSTAAKKARQASREQSAAERLRTEAEKLLGKGLDLSDLGGTLHGRNGSVSLEVLHPLDWDFDAQDRLETGDYAGFLQAVLSAEEYEKARTVRPSNWQVLQWVTGVDRAPAADESASSAAAEDLGESPAS